MTTGTSAPFTAADYQARMERAARSAADAGLAGVLVAPGPDLVWLTGYHVPADTERLTLLVLAAGQRPTLVVPTLEAPDAAKAAGADAMTLRDWTDGKNPYDITAPLLEKSGRFGVSDNAWAMHLLGLQKTLPDTSYVSLTEALPMLRAVKDAAELERLAAAGAAADATYEEIKKVPFAGRKEIDLSRELADLLRRFGHEQVDFTLVCSGPNAANPHHAPGDRVVRDGDMIVLDFGGLKDGYGSDTSRTVHVGEPTAEEREVHDIVRAAQTAACDAVRPGIACQDVDRVAREVITDAGYGEYFIHRTGHGIGVTTHEPPYMIEGESQELVPGMCFSVEPGIYLPGRFGVRIEDIVTVTGEDGGGGKRLNATSRDLAIVG
ncbi:MULTISPECIES: aminopeptidase P family protein [unclassified Streptomyces]|uniref:aminopeptidase P family protein n=1 Tax=unclassified Streptomyces TaxID=2593676 RepID=UPI000DBA1B2F|nr:MULTISPECIES: aminopeptidase P family protein [unclassified Streptomyces]MYT73956.1 M24 family metallopeptidase [Streptomyces sp. SID8367]RAJ89370.1 D-alanyl-D-alanine dipeptidase [Streptomyces sp. PsTaAH-137]